MSEAAELHPEDVYLLHVFPSSGPYIPLPSLL